DWRDPTPGKAGLLGCPFRLGGPASGPVGFEPSVEAGRAAIGPPPLADLIARPDEPDAAPEVSAHAWRQLIATRLRTQTINLQTSDAIVRWLNARTGDLITFSMQGGDRQDRARKDEDALDPEAAPPQLDAVELELEKLLPELHRIRPLPRELLTVQVKSGHWLSDEVELDLRFGLVAPVVLALHLDDEATARLPELAKGPPASCAA